VNNPGDELIRTVNKVFQEGDGLYEPMRGAVLEANSEGQLYFSLQSGQGLILETEKRDSLSIPGTWKQNAFQVIVPEDSTNKRFIFSTSQKNMNVISCFLVNGSPFFATIALSDPQKVRQCLSAGIINLLGMICIRCQTVLAGYIQQLLKPIGEPVPYSIPHCREKLVVKQIAEYSDEVNCTALIDADGFILNAQGNTEEVEKTASNVARFHQRCIRELGLKKTVKINSETFSCERNTVLVGQIRHTSLALAISTRGPHSKSLASFLFGLAQSAFGAIIETGGTLWGVRTETEKEPARLRNSWFGTAQLIPKGKCASKKGGKTFHFATCRILLKSEDDDLNWYERRADAIRAGLMPCKSCNP
jgi:hypothetical protein